MPYTALVPADNSNSNYNNDKSNNSNYYYLNYYMVYSLVHSKSVSNFLYANAFLSKNIFFCFS